MTRHFIIARNPVSDSRLPLLLQLPLAPRPLFLATRAEWPVEKDLYCHELTEWPEDAEVLDRVPVISCQRRGSSIELVLNRSQRRRSLFVFTASKYGKRLVFWRSERSMRATRPGVRAPQARGLDGPMLVAIDTRERYPWRFVTNPVTVERRRLPVGDYGVFDGDELAAVVERKKLKEFAGAAVNGQLALAMAELAVMPRAAVVIEGRLSKLLASDETRVRPGWLLNLTAALQAAYPNVPLLFAESGPLAADLAYRWLSACMSLRRAAHRGRSAVEALNDVLGEHGASGAGPLFAPPQAAPVRTAPQRAVPQRSAPQQATELGFFSGRSVRRAEAPLDQLGRQALALAHVAECGAVTVAEHAARCGVTPPTSSKDLHALVAEGRLVARGRARSLRFEPAQPQQLTDGVP